MWHSRTSLPTAIVAIVFFMVGLTACGSGTGSGDLAPTDTAPSIDGFTFSPQSATKGSGGGVVYIIGTATVTAPYGGVIQSKIMRLDQQGHVLETISWRPSAPLSATKLQTSISYPGSTAVSGKFPFAISVVDSQGRESAWKYGVFEVFE